MTISTATLNVGFGGLAKHACAALADSRSVLGVCEQERVTRVRGAGGNLTGIPDEALDALLAQTRRGRGEIESCAIAEDAAVANDWRTVRFGHHEAHACTAYLTSPLDSAVVLICDHESPGVSVWQGKAGAIRRIEWPWAGLSFSDLYSECARLLGFGSDAGAQRFEALGRLQMGHADTVLPPLFSTDGSRIAALADWTTRVRDAVPASATILQKARVAAELQRQIGSLLLELLRRVSAHTSATTLCVGGSFFYHSSMNTIVKESGLFDRAWVPADPGNPGLSVGTAMQVSDLPPQRLSPFLGPCFDPDQMKAELDNCKLRYDWLDEGLLIEAVVRHLQEGRLVAWFEGRMEWGPRALGARSILASPFSPFVLENLNHFLKRRESWRGYALSTLADEAPSHFSGPAEAPFMECDYRPLDAARFRHVMPSEAAHVRVQTVSRDSPPRFRALLEAFGRATGVPCLVNTSFNGFHEPIVCTPRDAVRVFYGSGVDVLFLDRFILTK
jgi:carbamoyltransferase